MNVVLNGYGTVARALVRHWKAVAPDITIQLIRRQSGQWRVDDGMTAGMLPMDELIFSPETPSLEAILTEVPIDAWFELTPTNVDTAKDDFERVRTILSQGIPVMIANKAIVLHDYLALKQAADEAGTRMGLSAVLGASLPAYALAHYGAMGATITRMEGVLNGTTNFMLGQMEQGMSFEESLLEAQRVGIAEPNSEYDVSGFDSAVKMAILASIIRNRNIPVHPQNVEGIRQVNREMVRDHLEQGLRYKLVATFEEERVSVAPRLFSRDELFYQVNHTDKVLRIETDTLSTMSVVSGASNLPEVAASLHRDLLSI